jgi:hypothetical protein
MNEDLHDKIFARLDELDGHVKEVMAAILVLQRNQLKYVGASALAGAVLLFIFFQAVFG